jgi:type IV pilus assembly protein PilW
MGKLRKKRLANLQQGFTLVELLVAMAMAGIVIGAIYSTYKSQQDSYIAQEQVAEMQQNLRAALYMMARDIRMAGFNPADSPNVDGFVTGIPVEIDPPDTLTNDENISFTIDRDEDGAVNADDHNEQIAYRIDNNRLEKYMYNASVPGWQWETISENIDALDFVYRDQNGNAIVISPTTLQDIRSVDITIVARSGRTDQHFTDTQAYFNQEDLVTPILAAQNDNFRRRLLTTNIACRNMGI